MASMVGNPAKLGGTASGTSHSTGEVSLNDVIEGSGCYCLNEKADKPWRNLLSGGGAALPLESDADEQLLLHFTFRQTVKLSSIDFGLPENDSCPQTIKLFLNTNNLGFDDASSNKPVEQFEIDDEELSKFTFKVKPVKWSRVESITIFVEDNHGNDISSLVSINFNGVTIQGTNVADIGPC